MACKILPTPNELRQLFRYESETGSLFWNIRPRSHFKREQDCLRWNTCFAHKKAGGIRGTGHIFVAINNKSHLVHRIIWAIEHGEWPEREIDHINGNPADNRLINLRSVSHRDNMQNLRRGTRNSTGAMGVYTHKSGRYRVRIGKKNLGYFATLEDAKAAWASGRDALGYHANHGRDAIADDSQDRPSSDQLAG